MNYPVSLIFVDHHNSRLLRMKLYSNPGYLILRGRSEFNGFAGKDEERFWSTGVLEYWKKSKPEFQLELVFALLHHSTTPLLQHTF